MPQLLDVAIDTKVKLCALWTSAMLCAICSESVRLYVPGTLERMRAFGSIRIEGAEGAWMWIAIAILTPILMIFLSVALPAGYNRILNIVVGLYFVLSWGFGTLMRSMLPPPRAAGTVLREAAVSLEAAIAVFAALVVWYAWTWPTKPNAV